MNSTLDKRAKDKGIDRLWLGRTSALEEKQTLAQKLLSVSSEISVVDRLLFFHTTPDEAEEKRLKSRLSDLEKMVGQSTSQIEAAWNELSTEFPAFTKARQLEAVMALALWARSEEDRVRAHAACNGHLDAALANLNARPDAVELSPAAAAGTLFSAPQDAYLVPLVGLRAVLGMACGLQETTWDGPRRTLLYRPLILDLVGATIRAFRAAEPDTPLPIELAANWQENTGTQTAQPTIPVGLQPTYPEGMTRQPFEIFKNKLIQLGGHDLCTELVKGAISTLDRVVFWSDTPAEAKKKSLLADRELLAKEIAQDWENYTAEVAEQRKQVWEAYSSDQALVIRDAVSAITTPSGESSFRKSCPLLNQEPALAEVHTMQEVLKRDHGLSWKRFDLLDLAIKSQQPESAPLPDQSGYVPFDQIVPFVSHLLVNQNLTGKYRELRSSMQQSQHHRSQHQSSSAEISTWDRLNVFSETDAERHARESAGALEEASRQARYLGQTFFEEIDATLSHQHPPLLACFLCEELATLLDQVRAECTSRQEQVQRRRSDGEIEYKTKTIYYCRLVGIDRALTALGRLTNAMRPKTGQVPSALAALECRALLDSQESELVVTLLGSGGV